jgi:hypothetical protein
VKYLFFSLVTAWVASAQAVELYNEKGEASIALSAVKGLTAGVLIDEQGNFFCNGFVIRRRAKFELATASHCVRDRWQHHPLPRTLFVYQDDGGTTRSVELTEPATYLGEVETADQAEGRDPLDIALIPLQAQKDWKPIEWEKTAAQPQSAFVVYYHRLRGKPEDSLYLQIVPCNAAEKIPAVRVTIRSTDSSTRRLDYFTAVTAKGQVHDESVDLFLDRCKIPLPEGASGGLVVDSLWRPMGLLHTGITTHHFSLGWNRGGWKQKAALAPGDGLQGHFLASDAKAYGPLPNESLFEGRGNPLFLFGAALRLNVAVQHIKD